MDNHHPQFSLFFSVILLTLSFSTKANTFTIDFDGDENGTPMAAGVFPSGDFLDTNGNLFHSEGNSYIEDNFEHNAIVFTNQEFGSHVHATVNPFNNFSVASNLANDAGGAFFRQLNDDSFSLKSWDFVSLTTLVENQLFNSNPSLFNPSPESHLIVQGSFNGTELFTLDFFEDTTPLGTFDFLVATNGASANIDLLEYWFSGTGRGVIPLGEHSPIGLVIDNVMVSNVPIPAAIYFFLSSLIGLFVTACKHNP